MNYKTMAKRGKRTNANVKVKAFILGDLDCLDVS